MFQNGGNGEISAYNTSATELRSSCNTIADITSIDGSSSTSSLAQYVVTPDETHQEVPIVEEDYAEVMPVLRNYISRTSSIMESATHISREELNYLISRHRDQERSPYSTPYRLPIFRPRTPSPPPPMTVPRLPTLNLTLPSATPRPPSTVPRPPLRPTRHRASVHSFRSSLNSNVSSENSDYIYPIIPPNEQSAVDEMEEMEEDADVPPPIPARQYIRHTMAENDDDESPYGQYHMLISNFIFIKILRFLNFKRYTFYLLKAEHRYTRLML